MKSFNIKTKSLRLSSLVVALGASLLIVACGGGGGGGEGPGGGPVPPVNQQAWQGALSLEDKTGQVDTPDVAVNASGVAYAIWAQVDGDRQKVFSSRYINGAWEAAQTVSEDVLANDTADKRPQIVVHPDGRASAVWTQKSPNGNVNVMVDTTDDLGVWAFEDAIQNVPAVGRIQLESDGKGQAMAIWDHGGLISASRFNGVKFEDRDLVSAPADVDATSASVAMHDGRALAVWVAKLANGKERAFVRNFSNGAWEPVAFAVSRPDSDNVLATDVALQADGKAVVAWSDQIAGGAQVVARIASDATTFKWELPQVLENTGNNFFPAVAMDPQGRAVVVWEQQVAGISDVLASRFDGASWGNANVQSTDKDALQMQVGMDGDGRAFVVWTQFTATQINVMSNRMDPVTGAWGTPELLETEDRGAAIAPSLAVSSVGRAVAVWMQADGATDAGGNDVNSIAANVFK